MQQAFFDLLIDGTICVSLCLIALLAIPKSPASFSQTSEALGWLTTQIITPFRLLFKAISAVQGNSKNHIYSSKEFTSPTHTI